MVVGRAVKNGHPRSLVAVGEDIRGAPRYSDVAFTASTAAGAGSSSSPTSNNGVVGTAIAVATRDDHHQDQLRRQRTRPQSARPNVNRTASPSTGVTSAVLAPTGTPRSRVRPISAGGGSFRTRPREAGGGGGGASYHGRQNDDGLRYDGHAGARGRGATVGWRSPELNASVVVSEEEEEEV